MSDFVEACALNSARLLIIFIFNDWSVKDAFSFIAACSMGAGVFFNCNDFACGVAGRCAKSDAMGEHCDADCKKNASND